MCGRSVTISFFVILFLLFEAKTTSDFKMLLFDKGVYFQSTLFRDV